MSGVGNNTYTYDMRGARVKKVSGGVTTTYYLDGNKILGEDRSDGTKLRYFYDIDGLCGIKVGDNRYYKCIRNAFGDVVLIVSGKDPVVRYSYDAWGNCKVYKYDNSEIGDLNPFRWRSHYYDAESGLYYANGSYYDPETGTHIDASEVSEIADNAFTCFALDRNGIMCNNILVYLPDSNTIATALQMSADPTYDPDANKSELDKLWEDIIEGISKALATFFNWINGLDWRLKIIVGVVLLALAIILTMVTQGVAAGLLALLVEVVFCVTGSMLSFTMAANYGEATLTDLRDALADGIFWAGIFAFVSASVNAIKSACRSVAKNANLRSGSACTSDCTKVGECFIAGTLVLTKEGLKPIEEIEVGDEVLAYDEETGEQAYKPVTRLFRNTTEEWYHIRVNGEEIVCTGGHPFYVLNAENDRNIVNFEGVKASGIGKWICAMELKVSDKVLLSDGSRGVIEQIEIQKLDFAETTYNFEVADFHTYYVSDNKVLVHNDCVREALSKANVENFTIKNKHLSSSGGNWSKFNVGTEAEAKAILKETLKKGKILQAGNNAGKLGSLGQKSFDVLLDAGRIIGTKGETSIFIILDEIGNIWTVFPK